ncbi:hypothetical protein H920_11018 [Fukomys damarensis]|uniref:Uncharacterized protein n=1 Tax=Fukomys damarensis TaxID=885580 RepID=A0A091D952_FUKDA|nr:hypothetical protein H920_11018 [Fukomys damarensis]
MPSKPDLLPQNACRVYDVSGLSFSFSRELYLHLTLSESISMAVSYLISALRSLTADIFHGCPSPSHCGNLTLEALRLCQPEFQVQLDPPYDDIHFQVRDGCVVAAVPELELTADLLWPVECGLAWICNNCVAPLPMTCFPLGLLLYRHVFQDPVPCDFWLFCEVKMTTKVTILDTFGTLSLSQQGSEGYSRKRTLRTTSGSGQDDADMGG